MAKYFALSLLIAGICLAADDGDVYRMMRSEDIQERTAAANKLLDERGGTISALENVIRDLAGDSSRRGTVKSAIDVLGELRAEEAIPLLVQNLTLEVFYKETKRTQGVTDLFPAVGALIKIGIQSIDPVLQRSTQADDADLLRTSSAVVRGVLGPELAKARVQLELRRTTAREATRRLNALLASISTQ
jgi:hypothetical protein